MDWAYLDAMTEVYMNLHGMDLQDDALWGETREHVRALLHEGIWNPREEA